MKIRIGSGAEGKEYEVADEGGAYLKTQQTRLDSADRQAKSATESLGATKVELDKERGRADALDAEMKKMEHEDYSPDQARDSNGRWGEEEHSKHAEAATSLAKASNTKEGHAAAARAHRNAAHAHMKSGNFGKAAEHLGMSAEHHAASKVDGVNAQKLDSADLWGINAKVKERVSLERQAGSILGSEFKMDALDNTALRVEVVKKSYPEIKLDGKSADYVTALFDQAITAKAKRNPSLEGTRIVAQHAAPQMRADSTNVPSGAEAARRRMVHNSETDYQRLGKVKYNDFSR